MGIGASVKTSWQKEKAMVAESFLQGQKKTGNSHETRRKQKKQKVQPKLRINSVC